MLWHFLTISWRNILRNKFYTLILLIGLVIGITSVMLLGMYTWNELTYDNFHDKKDRIYLVGVREKQGENEGTGGWTTPPTGPALQEFFAEIEATVRLCTWFSDVLVSRGDIRHAENNIIGADSTIFKVFTFPLISGDPESALKQPNSIVITEDIARKYFGNENPLGKTLHFDHFFSDCVVTGVMKTVPDNSHFKLDILLSLSSLKNINFDFDHWSNHTFSTYVLLNENSKPEYIESRISEFLQKNMDPYLISRFQKSFAEMYRGGDMYELFLMPLKDVHLSTMLYDNREGKRMLTYALGVVGVFILVLVAINYTNLATVLTFSRAKEVGIRKVTGSKNGLLVKQFIMESILVVFMGLFIALGLIEILLPYFNSLTQNNLSLNYSDPKLIVGLIVFAVGLGALSAVYPAITFSSFNPIRALKGITKADGKGAGLRNTLVIFQFTICIIMIVSTLVVFKQFKFMTTKNAGFNKDQILVIKRAEGLKEKKVAFKNELVKHPGIMSVSYSETTPAREFNGHSQHFAGTPAHALPVIHPLVADIDILETLDLKLVAGKPFNGYDQAILNEAAVRMLNLKNPLDETIDKGTLGVKNVNVIGVVMDFHYKSFHFEVEPLVIFPLDIENDPQHRATFVLVKVDGKNIPSTLNLIEDMWKQHANAYPFEYSFLDDDFNKMFERESTMMKVYTIFSIISVCIACLGLLGLASFFANKRTKEIGIRKIVGASFLNIAKILSYDFLKWIVIAVMLGSAISWYLMNEWLQNFAYQTELSWWLFLIAGVFVVLISVMTVSWNLYKAATRNPVETLRYE